MNPQNQTELKFVGGPFDGFYELIPSKIQLPACVALPLNAAAGRIFGVKVGRAQASRVAIYGLHKRDGLSSYRFQRMIDSECLQASASIDGA